MQPILVVDDEHELLSLLKEEFDSYDIESSTADNTESAIELLKTESFSCLFLDIVLGKTSSEKVIEFLKSPENTINIDLPVVIMSGYVDPSFIERVQAKVYKVIEKPFKDGLIKSIIADLPTQETVDTTVSNDISEDDEDPFDL